MGEVTCDIAIERINCGVLTSCPVQGRLRPLTGAGPPQARPSRLA